MSEDLTREDLTAAVDAVVAAVLEAAGVTQPPVDAVALAERHFGLVLDFDQPPRGRQRMHSPGETSPEKRQWLAARAVADRMRHDVFERLGLPTEGPRPLLGESPSTLLALRLLMPTPWFAEDARACGHDVAELRPLYPITLDLIAWRLLDLPAPCIITVLDNGAVTKRRCNVRHVPRELAPAERECQRYVHQYGRPRVVRAAGWTVQGWPVHEPDWKREILRSVVDAEFD
jgi:hypothetical protein